LVDLIILLFWGGCRNRLPFWGAATKLGCLLVNGFLLPQISLILQIILFYINVH